MQADAMQADAMQADAVQADAMQADAIQADAMQADTDLKKAHVHIHDLIIQPLPGPQSPDVLASNVYPRVDMHHQLLLSRTSSKGLLLQLQHSPCGFQDWFQLACPVMQLVEGCAQLQLRLQDTQQHSHWCTMIDWLHQAYSFS